MSASHGHSTMGGIEYNEGGLCGEDKKGESLTSTRLINELGDAHRLMLMQGVGIAMQRMH